MWVRLPSSLQNFYIMIKTINFFEIEKYKNELINYKLCYISSIEEMIWDYDEDSKRIINSNSFNWEKDRWRLRTDEFPNPEFIPGQSTYYAYFTPISLDKQWGDDWDDTPYEYNAGPPYDDYYDENNKRIEITLYKIKFGIKSDNYHIPSYYGFGGNSPFCIKDINQGAVAWLFDSNGKKGVAIYAGDSPTIFKEKIEEISKNHPNWVSYKEEE